MSIVQWSLDAEIRSIRVYCMHQQLQPESACFCGGLLISQSSKPYNSSESSPSRFRALFATAVKAASTLMDSFADVSKYGILPLA